MLVQCFECSVVFCFQFLRLVSYFLLVYRPFLLFLLLFHLFVALILFAISSFFHGASAVVAVLKLLGSCVVFVDFLCYFVSYMLYLLGHDFPCSKNSKVHYCTLKCIVKFTTFTTSLFVFTRHCSVTISLTFVALRNWEYILVHQV